MRQETPESRIDCGVAVKDEAPQNLNSFGEPLPDEKLLLPIDPQNPEPGIDARLKLAIAAMREKHPEIPGNLLYLGL